MSSSLLIQAWPIHKAHIKENHITQKNSCAEFLQNLPKAELHVHIEGTLEPEQLLLFAKRNNVTLPIQTILTDDKKAYRFSDFHSFLEAYVAATQALCTQQDFYEMTLAYLEKAHQQGVVHAEIYFDIQTYAPRNINPDVVVYGIHKGIQEGFKRFGISASMIFSLLCYEEAQGAFVNFEIIRKRYKNIINTIGLAAGEYGDPITKFKPVFVAAHNEGYRCVTHAGEFHPELIWQALQNIPIERIDHGIACVSDQKLMQELARRKIPLTICPISNAMLNLCKSIQDHPIKKIYDADIMVTINSDDPAFFRSYVGDNYQTLLQEHILSCNQLVQCARNSINASFIDKERKQTLLALIDLQAANHTCT